MGPLRNFELKQHKFTTTYVKLQDAYVSESNMIGGWKKIGYVMNATTNFTYAGDTEDGIVSVTTGKADAWNATSNVALNDCAIGAKWQLDVSGADNGNSVTYTATTPACGEALTPTFSKIGK